MNSSEKNIAEEDMPEAVRRILASKKRRRRIIFAALGVLPFVLAGWWLWSNESGNRAIQAEIDRYRAAGQPIYPADFDPPPTPDENNAALALKNAHASLVVDLDADRYEFATCCNSKKIAKHHDEFRSIIKSNPKVFELVRQARSMTGADWGLQLRSPIIAVRIPNIGEQSDMVRFLCSTAIFYHQADNDAEAVELFRDALAAAKTMRKGPFLIFNLIAIAQKDIAYSAIEDITVDLKVLPASPKSAGRKQVRSLISELLDEAELRKGAQLVFYSERAYVLDTAMLVLDGKFSIDVSGAPSALERMKIEALKPALKKDVIRMLRYMTAQAEAAGQTNWPAAKEKMPEYPQTQGLLKRLTHMFSNTLLSTLSSVMKMNFQVRAMRRMSAVALAIRLYEIDNGHRPEKLADLVPKYLPAIPDDPFDNPGQPLRYLPNAQRPILYSIGSNGKDQGGQYAEDPEDGSSRYNDDYDIPFFLNADRPRYEEEESQEQEPPASQPRRGPRKFGSRGMIRSSGPTPTATPR